MHAQGWRVFLRGSYQDLSTMSAMESKKQTMKTVFPRAILQGTLPDVLYPMMNDERAPLPGCFLFERC